MLTDPAEAEGFRLALHAALEAGLLILAAPRAAGRATVSALGGPDFTAELQARLRRRREAASEISASEKKALAAISTAIRRRLWVRLMGGQ